MAPQKNLVSAALMTLFLGFGITGCDPEGEARPERGDGIVWEDVDDSQTNDGEDRPRIYGGGPVAACAWPTTVSLGGSCTGTLINEEVVIYAAHCGANYNAVTFGNDIYSSEKVATEYCKIYPGYNGVGEGKDFAYCKLAEPVTDYPIVPPLMGCETDVLQPGQGVAVVGFGNADDNLGYGIKREVYTTLNYITNKNEAFVGGDGEDSCQGDSGGPVFVPLNDGSWRVFGITSYGGACGGGGYYSMMHLGMPWFESDSGIDLTPCTDAQGNWDPGPECAGFPQDPGQGGGNYPSCSSGPLSGVSATCGNPYVAPQPEPEPEPEPDPQPEPGPGPDDLNSCSGACGGQAAGGCWCDDQCTKYGDCCEDVVQQCDPANSCFDSCGGRAAGGCWCDEFCAQYGDCCGDKGLTCGG